MKNGLNQSSMDLLQWNNKAELEDALCGEIVAIIQDSISKFGDARILLSGGSTPFGVYQKLSKSKLDWSKVMVGLVDERMVDNTDSASNYGNLTKVFQDAIGLGALVLPMVMTTSDWTKNLFLVKETYEPFMERMDFILLGMGSDGHTASLFPEDSASEMDLNLDEITLLYTYAPSEPKLRMTCSKGMLNRARNTALMFTGQDKMKVFESAEQNQFPIHRLLSKSEHVKLYYTN
jgi:6-phosphogluconolactonase